MGNKKKALPVQVGLFILFNISKFVVRILMYKCSVSFLFKYYPMFKSIISLNFFKSSGDNVFL